MILYADVYVLCVWIVGHGYTTVFGSCVSVKSLCFDKTTLEVL